MVAALVLLLLAATPSGPDIAWRSWGPLLGEWVADAAPDGSTGGFTFEPAVEGRVLVRRNTANYPASKDRPAAHHEDLMVVFHEAGLTRADYFDNEGHVIHYAVTIADGKAQFVSDRIANAARFRLTYQWSDAKALSLTFEVAPPGSPDGFRPYIKASLHRK
jgi:hypothetical protein